MTFVVFDVFMGEGCVLLKVYFVSGINLCLNCLYERLS